MAIDLQTLANSMAPQSQPGQSPNPVEAFINSFGNTLKNAGNKVKDAYFSVQEPGSKVGGALDHIKVPFAGIPVPLGSIAKNTIFQKKSDVDETGRLFKGGITGTLSPEDQKKYQDKLNNMALMAGLSMAAPEALLGGEGAGMEGDAALSNGAEGVRDMRYKQGNFQTKSITNPLEASTETGAVREPVPMNPQPEVAPITESAPPPPTQTNPAVESSVNTGEPGKYKIFTKAGINGAERDALAQQATDNLPGTTAAEKYSSMAKRMSQISDNISEYNKVHPVSVPSSLLRQNYLASIDHLIAPEGTLESVASEQGMITPEKASQQADSFLQTLERKAGVKVSVDPETSLNNYSIEDLTKMKTTENDLNSKLLSKRYKDPSSLTPEEDLRLGIRDALDKTIIQKQPAIKDMTLEQSGLFSSTEPLQDYAKSEYADAQKLASQPNPNLEQKIVGAFSKRPITSSLITAGLSGLGLETYRGGKDLAPLSKIAGAGYNELFGDKAATSTTGGTGGQETAPPDFTSHMPIQDIKATTGVPITIDEYNQNIKSPMFAPGSNARAVLDQQLQQTKDTVANNLPDPVKRFMGVAPNSYKAMQVLNGTDLDSLSKTYKNLSGLSDFAAYTSNSSNPYAKQLVALDAVNGFYKQAFSLLTGKDPDEKTIIAPGDSGEQIKEKLAAQNNFIITNFKNNQPYWEAINPTTQPVTPTSNLPPVQSQTSLPAQPPAFPEPAMPAGFSMKQL